MNTKIKEEIELLEELINNPDTPQDEKDLYRETIVELKKELADDKGTTPKSEPKTEKPKTAKKNPAPKAPKAPSVPKSKPVSKPKETDKVKDWYKKNFPTDDLGEEINSNVTFKDVWKALVEGDNVYDVFEVGDSIVRENIFRGLSKLHSVDYDVIYNAWQAKGNLTEAEILSKKTGKAEKYKTETPKPLPTDADKMKDEIRERTGKTEEECEKIIAEYRALRQKAKKARAKRLDKLDEQGKLIKGTNEKTAAAIIEDTADAIKTKLEKQVDKLEREANSGNRTPEQIEARLSRNLDKLSNEMTKQATGFIKQIQSELAKADKTEAKQFLLNVREEIDELLSKFAGGGAVGDLVEGDLVELELTNGKIIKGKIEKINPFKIRTDSTSTQIIPNSLIKSVIKINKFAGGGHIELNTEIILTENAENGNVVRAVVTPSILEIIEDNQYKGGFKRYEIDIYDEVHREPTKKEIEELNSFFNEVIGENMKFDRGGAVGGKKKTKRGWNRDRMFVNQNEDYELHYDKNHKSDRGGYTKKKRFDVGGDIPSFEGKRFSKEEFDYRVNLSKHQIISDILDGTVDESQIKEFGDLDYFVDCNYYGDLIEDNYVPSRGYKFEFSIQNALNDWIKGGGIKKALENPEMFSDGGMVQTYNITQSNMSASSVNPGMFATGGSIEDTISYNESRIANLKELLPVTNEDKKENLLNQIAKIEAENERLRKGETVPRKRLFGLF